jgi:hypothetical protein
VDGVKALTTADGQASAALAEVLVERTQAAQEALHAANRAEAEAWSVRMESFGGPAQQSPTIGQCLTGQIGLVPAPYSSDRASGARPAGQLRAYVKRQRH